jgi:hypothetical protein
MCNLIWLDCKTYLPVIMIFLSMNLPHRQRFGWGWRMLNRSANFPLGVCSVGELLQLMWLPYQSCLLISRTPLKEDIRHGDMVYGGAHLSVGACA